MDSVESGRILGWLAYITRRSVKLYIQILSVASELKKSPVSIELILSSRICLRLRTPRRFLVTSYYF